MADDFYSTVKRRLWADVRSRSLSCPEPNARDLFLYLLTTPAATQIPGLLAIGEAVIADDLDWPVEGVRAAMAELVAAGMVKHDRTARLIWLPNAMKHNPPRSPDNVKGWAKHWRMLPECGLKAEAAVAMMTAFALRGVEFAAEFAAIAKIERATHGGPMVKATGAKRRAVTKETRFRVFERDGFTCKYCGAKPPNVVLEVDHVIPVASGGTNAIGNLVTCCEACNAGKGARPLSTESSGEGGV